MGGSFAVAAGCGGTTNTDTSSRSRDKEIVIAVLPKLVNIKYFAACRRGAQKAADELGVKLIYDGPTEPSGSEQNKFIDTWIRQGVDAICVAPNQPKTVKRFVEKAQQRGIKVICWDTDSPQCGRTLMVNQVDDIGDTLAQQQDTLQRVGAAYGELAAASKVIDEVKMLADHAAHSAANNAQQLTDMSTRAHGFESQVAAGMKALEVTLSNLNLKVDAIREDI